VSGEGRLAVSGELRPVDEFLRGFEVLSAHGATSRGF